MESSKYILSQEQVNKIESYFQLHPPSTDGKIISYGTAGFRDHAKYLNSIVMHSGILASLRSKNQASAAVGIIITASHNPNDDNGVKIIDITGEMLAIDWEPYATTLANCQKASETVEFINHFASKFSIDLTDEVSSTVLIARDTRTSGSVLTTAAKNGSNILSKEVIDFGILTTPQLHYIVRCTNQPSYGIASELGYYTKLSNAFKSFIELSGNFSPKNYSDSVTIDCANGVGSLKVQQLIDHISSDSFKLNVTLENTDISSSEKLNKNCGADYVKLNCKSPEGIDHRSNVKYVSFDGDADRIIYYYLDSSNKFHLVDGDKIAILFSHYLGQMLTATELKSELTFALVQTAYANGISTIYAQEELNLPVHCVPTGVKHLHHQAKQSDVAVYFEANGHGTILFSDKADALIRSKANDEKCLKKEVVEAAKKLAHLIDLTNQVSLL